MRVNKKNIKSIIILIITLTIMLGFIGCEKKESNYEVQRYAWPLATSSPEDTVTQIFAEKFASEVDKLSNGKMKIDIYPNSVLGGDRELLESCKDGDIPFVVQNTAPQVPFIKEAAVFDLPSAFSNIIDVRKAIDNKEFFDLMKSNYRKSGYELLGYADQGFRVMSTNKIVNNINDFKGQKIRTMENPYHISFWRNLGASPTPMTFSEVYIGLQQKTIDAEENPYEVIASNRLYEQQKYIIETNHLPHLISLIVSEKFYSNLTKDEQLIIDKASKIAVQYARKVSDERVLEKKKEIEKSGTKIIKISDSLYKEIKDKSKKVYNDISKTVGNELVEDYIKGEK